MQLQWIRGSRLVSRAATKAQLRDDELVGRLFGTPARLQLLVSAVEGSYRAAVEEKIEEAFADALRTGALADEEAVVDEEALFVRAMTDLRGLTSDYSYTWKGTRTILEPYERRACTA